MKTQTKWTKSPEPKQLYAPSPRLPFESSARLGLCAALLLSVSHCFMHSCSIRHSGYRSWRLRWLLASLQLRAVKRCEAQRLNFYKSGLKKLWLLQLTRDGRRGQNFTSQYLFPNTLIHWHRKGPAGPTEQLLTRSLANSLTTDRRALNSCLLLPLPPEAMTAAQRTLQ